MEFIFLIIQLVIAASLIGIVLIQRSSSDGFGLGSGSGSNFMSGRQAANFLTRTTAVLATLFILNSLWLSILATNKGRNTLADEVEAVKPTLQLNPETTMPTPAAPAAEPTVPAADESDPGVPAADETPVAPAAEEPAPEAAPAEESAPVEEPAAAPAGEIMPAPAASENAPATEEPKQDNAAPAVPGAQ